MGGSSRKSYLIVLGLIIIFSACAPKPKIKPLVPPPKPPAEKAAAPTPVSPPKAAKEAKKITPAPQKTAPSKAEKPAKKGLGVLEGEEDEDKYIVLNFEDADLEIVLQTISELIGMNYILGPRVKGKITIQTYNKIPREDLADVLHSILAINGFTTVKSGHYYKIITVPSAKQYPIETKIGKPKDIKAEDVMVTQIIPLEYIAASELNRIIKPLVSKGGSIIIHKDTNLLILNELSSNLKRLFRIINLLDVPTESTTGEKIFVYYVENGDAGKLASTLNSIYKKKKKGGKRAVVKTAAAKALDKIKKRRKKKTKAKSAKSVESELEGEMLIVADTEINALIIKTTVRDYKLLLELLKKLDILPRQVLIEVLIANVSLDDSTIYGLEWAATGPFKGGSKTTHIAGATGNASIGLPDSPTTTGLATGFTYLIERTNLFKAMINLQVSKGNVEILSSPHILTANNKEATINIVDQEPIQKTNTTSTGIVTTSWEYKDAGIKLVVKPKINDKGLVALDIKLEVSEVKSGAGTGNPIFAKRNVKTSLVVQDGQTLIIGGLIKEKHTLDRTGVPWLMDIPYLGYLFGTTTDAVVKNELVMMITPRVIGSIEEASELSGKFKKDVDRMKKYMKEQAREIIK